MTTETEDRKARLEYLRAEIDAERISYGEILELQALAPYIDSADTLLLAWAGVEEPYSCDGCGTVYDEASGDGYCGLCPKCADEVEEQDTACRCGHDDCGAC